MLNKKYYKSMIAAIFVVAYSTIMTGAFPIVAMAASKSTTKPAASTATVPKDISGEVTQSYNAAPSVEIGMVVRLKEGDPRTVVPLDQKSSNQILGIVVPNGNATIVLTNKDVSAQQVLVSNVGHFGVIVSNQNGPIKAGDFIMISAISGVGMRADSKTDTQVVGKAASNFNGTSNVIGSVEVSDTVGRKTTVSLGRIQLNAAISHNPLFAKNADYVPAGLAKIAQAVTDKPVSAARVYLGLVIIVVAAFIAGSTVFSGVRSGMISIGRNPLSKKSIIKSLIQTVMAGLMIFIVGIFAVYLLLKL